jgi:drug/metabolite transporter (DMT)-like permease
VRKQTDSMTAACWVAVGAAAASLTRGVVGGTLQMPTGHLMRIVAMLLAGLVLGEGISSAQALGGVAILTAAVVIARSHHRERAQNVRGMRRVDVQTRTVAVNG